MECWRREYADFRVSSDGEVQGVGLLIAADPSSGRLVVLAPIQGGPADRAGIQPGDEARRCFLSCMPVNWLGRAGLEGACKGMRLP